MWQSPEATMVLDSNYRLLSLLGSTQYMITGFSILAFSLPFTKSNKQKGPSLLAISTDTQWNIIMITFISLLQFPHVLKNKPTKQASNQELTECCLRVCVRLLTGAWEFHPWPPLTPPPPLFLSAAPQSQ